MEKEIIIRLLISLALGSIIGIEREYRSKAAGFRTIIMICLGSTLFTMLSLRIGAPNNTDRIASNIITGIGFLGAGVIFKDGLSVTGITTATTIWISAALGMTVGAGEYFIAAVASVIVIIVLSLFEKIQLFIDDLHQMRSYKIFFDLKSNIKNEIDGELNRLRLKFRKKKEMKDNGQTIYVFEIFGNRENLDTFNTFLKNNAAVKSYEY